MRPMQYPLESHSTREMDVQDSESRIVQKLIGGFIACFGLCILHASAQTYPVKPVRVILGTAEKNDAAQRLFARLGFRISSGR